jgi:hypothetical protein
MPIALKSNLQGVAVLIQLLASDFGQLGVFLLFIFVLPFVPAILVTALWPFTRSPRVSRRSRIAYLITVGICWIGGVLFVKYFVF